MSAIRCPRCGHRLEGAASKAGQCPNCRTVVSGQDHFAATRIENRVASSGSGRQLLTTGHGVEYISTSRRPE